MTAISSMPEPILITMIVMGCLIVAAVITKGNSEIGFGKWRIKIGDSSKRKPASCTDCILVISSWFRDGSENMVRINNRIERESLSYREQKVITIQQMIYAYFVLSQASVDSSLYQPPYSKSLESQNLSGILRGYYQVLSDELKRAILENGFHKLTGEELDHYCLNLAEGLISRGEQFLITEYPSNHMLVKYDSFFTSNVKFIRSTIQATTKDIITTVKSIKAAGEKEISDYDKSIKQKINKYLGIEAM